METLSIVLVLALVCTLAWLTSASGEDAQQAALLPFADDPEAARRMTAETGLVCNRVVRPEDQPEPAPVWLA